MGPRSLGGKGGVMGKYTPGPWKHETVFDKIGNPCAYSVWTCNQFGRRNRICVTPDGTTCENMSNAQLIAAAPDIYEALKIILEYPYGDASPLEDPLVIERARAAIRKAGGEE